MAKFLLKMRGQGDPKGKPRVYFTCHHEDFSLYFERICKDVLKTHDCAIYYTEDMRAEMSEEDRALDLGQMNLFLVPVTFRLLREPNRAMDSDIAFAKEKNIPILPFMMETGIDEVYSRPDKFGKRQYLSPNSTDITEVKYEDKLKSYLDSVLISEKTAARVRAAFDAYIFLSYRKKDRKYANELMRLIHKNPDYRDIAIWYDEFLTPGESFSENIKAAMKKSKLFTLLVTPQLLEYVDGNKNYVMEHEYPDAKEAGMDILPAEMEKTDKDALKREFLDIPECTDPRDGEFESRLAQTLSGIATSASEDSPEHNFLIGLAYLDGIDVEKDAERAVELITSAAEAGLFEAMKKLYDMYSEGAGTGLDYGKAAFWAEKIYEYNKEKYGGEHPQTLASLNNLSYAYGKLGEYQKSLNLYEKAYALYCKVLGEEHPRTLVSLGNLAYAYGKLGEYQKALGLNEKVYTLRRKVLGEEHPDTLTSLNNLAFTYGKLGEHQKALGLNEKVYTLRRKVLGEEHPRTLVSLNNLAGTYGDLGEYQKALELYEKAYALRCKVLGEEHPDTLTSLSDLASVYGDLGEHQKALGLNEKVYALRRKLLGDAHPDTLLSLNTLAYTYGKLGEYQKSSELYEKAYALRCKVLGDEHPYTLTSLNNLAYTYGDLGEYQKSLPLYEKLYALCCKVLGEEHPKTLTTLSNLAWTEDKLGHCKRACELQQKLCDTTSRVLGEDHPTTVEEKARLKEWLAKLGDQ